jgi:hypothetical protein
VAVINRRLLTDMINEIASSLRIAWTDLVEGLEQVPLPLWNESVFRFLFIRSLLKTNPVIDCETEWERHDLLILLDKAAVLVEFKFFQDRLGRSINDKRRRKGGAGVQNFREFCEAAEKLAARMVLPTPQIGQSQLVGAFLILAYADREDQLPHQNRHSFSDFYDEVKLPEKLQARVVLREQVSLEPAECKKSRNTIKCKLFEITAP